MLTALQRNILICAALISLFRIYYGSLLTQVLTVGVGFTAKTVCSCLFVSNFSSIDVNKHELNGLPSYLTRYTVDYEHKIVYAHLPFFNYAFSNRIGLPVSAVGFVNQHAGCRVFNSHENLFPIDSIKGVIEPKTAINTFTLPTNITKTVQDLINFEFTSKALEVNQTRAIVVLHRGTVVAEGYQERLGINAGKQ